MIIADAGTDKSPERWKRSAGQSSGSVAAITAEDVGTEPEDTAVRAPDRSRCRTAGHQRRSVTCDCLGIFSGIKHRPPRVRQR